MRERRGGRQGVTARHAMHARAERGMLISSDVEVLDFAGPFEVFSRTRRCRAAIRGARTTARRSGHSPSRAARRRHRDRRIEGDPVLRVGRRAADRHIVVPGGFGTRALLATSRRSPGSGRRPRHPRGDLGVHGRLAAGAGGPAEGPARDDAGSASNCWHRSIRRFRSSASARRHDGVVTSAGVSAGLDMSFGVVEKICGRAVAEETAHYIEYVPKYQDAV